MITYCNVASAALMPLWLSHAVAVTLISPRLFYLGGGGLAANGARGAILLLGDVAGPQPHPPPHDCTFVRPGRAGPRFPGQAGIGSGWACHRDPLFQNQPFLA